MPKIKKRGGRLNVRKPEKIDETSEVIYLDDLGKKIKKKEKKNPIIILPIKDIRYTSLFKNYDYKSSDKDMNIPIKIKMKNIDKIFDLYENIDKSKKNKNVSLDDVLKTYYFNHPGQILIYNEEDEEYEPLNIDTFKKIQEDLNNNKYNDGDYDFDTFSKNLLDYISLDKENKNLLNKIGYTNLPLSIFGEKDIGLLVSKMGVGDTVIGIPSQIAFGIYNN